MAASASIAALKTLLDTLVYTNTSNAITGNGLNEALDDIIDTLDALKTGPEIFWATYGTTTFADCLAAYNAGKLVAVLVNSQYVEVLCRVQASAITFACQIGTYLYRAQVSSADVWTNNIYENEVASNKVTTLSAQSTDTEYPSAKCVYDLLGDVETLLAAI